MLLIQLTGLSGAGKSTLANAAQRELIKLGYKVEVIDGDEYRHHLCRDLAYSRADRLENIRRLGFVGLTLARQGVIAILAAINPYQEGRKVLQEASPLVKTVYVSCPLKVLKQRDVKGLYNQALLPKTDPGRLNNFTGISDPYEAPESPDLVLNTNSETSEASLQRFLGFILENIGVGVGNSKVQAPSQPRALFIGRWQPFHLGHMWLIDQKLSEGVPVLVAVRDVPCDADNPYSTEQTIEMIRRVYAGRPVEVMALPDIESVNYGRGVGYAVNCFLPPADIEAISATFIRKNSRLKKEAWKNFVDETIRETVESGLNPS